jgi:hypothetical protein
MLRAMPRPTGGKKAPGKKAASRVKPAAAPAKLKAKGQPAVKAKSRRPRDVVEADATLFRPLSEGERADALRTMLEDERLREMAKIARYKVITVEALVTKPPDSIANRRLARVVVYDYAADRCVDVCVDLERGAVCHVVFSTAQPMLSRDEEADAIQVAVDDPKVQGALQPGEVALAVFHYWSRRRSELAYRRRSAAVVFGQAGLAGHIAVVDIIDRVVTEIIGADQW